MASSIRGGGITKRGGRQAREASDSDVFQVHCAVVYAFILYCKALAASLLMVISAAASNWALRWPAVEYTKNNVENSDRLRVAHTAIL